MYDNRPKVTVKTKGGISFMSLLQIAFIVLKLCKVIEWSWLWVFAPTWIIPTLLAIVLIVAIIIGFIK